MSLMRHLFPSFDGPERPSFYLHTRPPRRKTWRLVLGAFAAGAACTVAVTQFAPSQTVDPASSGTAPTRSASPAWGVHAPATAAETMETEVTDQGAPTGSPAVSRGTKAAGHRTLRVTPTLGSVALPGADKPADTTATADPAAVRHGAAAPPRAKAAPADAPVIEAPATKPARVPGKAVANSPAPDAGPEPTAVVQAEATKVTEKAADTSAVANEPGKVAEQARRARYKHARAKPRRNRPAQDETVVRAYDYLTPDGRRTTVYQRAGGARVRGNEDYAYRPFYSTRRAFVGSADPSGEW